MSAPEYAESFFERALAAEHYGNHRAAADLLDAAIDFEERP